MEPPWNRYHLIISVTVISLFIAVLITIFFSAAPPSQEFKPGNNKIPHDSAGDNLTKKGEQERWIVRVLWFDDQNLSYSFEDYQSIDKPDPENYTITQNPPVQGAKPAMIRFLSWDGTTERTIRARYIEDQERVTQILNRYSLKGSKNTPAPVVPTETILPLPSRTPAPGSLTPEAGVVCRNPDRSFTATFGYISSNDERVVLQIGEENKFFPGELSRGQPVIFEPGIHHEAFSITYPANVTNQIWTLMGRQVSGGMVPEVNTTIFVDPQSGYAPVEIKYSSRESGGTKDNPLTEEWDLGDGTISHDKISFTHRYENPGLYSIRYIVSNRCNQASDEATVRVYRTSFTWDNDPDTQNSIKFEDTSEGEPEVWFWDFSDGYTSWDKNPVHTFPKAGTYNVGLTISGKNGNGMVAKPVVVK